MFLNFIPKEKKERERERNFSFMLSLVALWEAILTFLKICVLKMLIFLLFQKDLVYKWFFFKFNMDK